MGRKLFHPGVLALGVLVVGCVFAVLESDERTGAGPMVAEVAGAQGRVADEVTLDAGEAHTCLLTAVGGVKCWGANTDGQLGTGDTTPSNVVRDVVGLASGVTQLSVGGSHSCAIDTAQQVTCWGMNDHGQVGDGTTTTRSALVAVVGIDTTILAVSAGQTHTCVLARSGVISCWGSNADGELGLGYASASDVRAPTAVDAAPEPFVSLSAGTGVTCAVGASGNTYCWGADKAGQLGDGTTTTRARPVLVSGVSGDGTRIVVGRTHTCALRSGAVSCWGQNAVGQLGIGSAVDQSTAQSVRGLSGVTSLAAAGDHACAIDGSGAVWCGVQTVPGSWVMLRRRPAVCRSTCPG